MATYTPAPGYAGNDRFTYTISTATSGSRSWWAMLAVTT